MAPLSHPAPNLAHPFPVYFLLLVVFVLMLVLMLELLLLLRSPDGDPAALPCRRHRGGGRGELHDTLDHRGRGGNTHQVDLQP